MKQSILHREIKYTISFEWYGWMVGESKFVHRENGPAYITYYDNWKIVESQSYHQNNLCHRIDGPAVVCYREDGSIRDEFHCLLGREISAIDFNTPGFIDAFILEHS